MRLSIVIEKTECIIAASNGRCPCSSNSPFGRTGRCVVSVRVHQHCHCAGRLSPAVLPNPALATASAAGVLNYLGVGVSGRRRRRWRAQRATGSCQVRLLRPRAAHRQHWPRAIEKRVVAATYIRLRVCGACARRASGSRPLRGSPPLKTQADRRALRNQRKARLLSATASSSSCRRTTDAATDGPTGRRSLG